VVQERSVTKTNLTLYVNTSMDILASWLRRRVAAAPYWCFPEKPPSLILLPDRELSGISPNDLLVLTMKGIGTMAGNKGRIGARGLRELIRFEVRPLAAQRTQMDMTFQIVVLAYVLDLVDSLAEAWPEVKDQRLADEEIRILAEAFAAGNPELKEQLGRGRNPAEILAEQVATIGNQTTLPDEAALDSVVDNERNRSAADMQEQGMTAKSLKFPVSGDTYYVADWLARQSRTAPYAGPPLTLCDPFFVRREGRNVVLSRAADELRDGDVVVRQLLEAEGFVVPNDEKTGREFPTEPPVRCVLTALSSQRTEVEIRCHDKAAWPHILGLVSAMGEAWPEVKEQLEHNENMSNWDDESAEAEALLFRGRGMVTPDSSPLYVNASRELVRNWLQHHTQLVWLTPIPTERGEIVLQPARLSSSNFAGDVLTMDGHYKVLRDEQTEVAHRMGPLVRFELISVGSQRTQVAIGCFDEIVAPYLHSLVEDMATVWPEIRERLASESGTRPSDADAPPSDEQKRTVNPKIGARAESYRRTKERHPEWTMEQVASDLNRFGQSRGEEPGFKHTVDTVRGAYRAMEWSWPRGARRTTRRTRGGHTPSKR
jgi:hypothetical protein